MKNNNNRRRKVKGRNQNHIRKILYEEIELWAPKVKINTSPFLNTSITQINKVRVVIKDSDKILTSTDKILTRYWQNKLQSPRVEDKRTTDKLCKMRIHPLLSFILPVLLLPGLVADQSEVRTWPNSVSTSSNPTLTFLLRWKEENSRPTLKFSQQTPRQRDSESNDDFNERIAQWLSTRPERPDCQLDSKQAVIRDFGYGEKILSIT